jgi:hypothetical protein
VGVLALLALALPSRAAPLAAVRGVEPAVERRIATEVQGAGALAIDRQGEFYVVDGGRCRVEIRSAQGTWLHSIGRCGSSPDGGFLDPRGIAAGAGFFFALADAGNGRVVRYATNLDARAFVFDRVLLQVRDLPGGVFRPIDLDYDPAGRLAVLDAETHQILLLDPFGRIERRFGGFGNLPGRLRAPRAVAYDRRYGVFVADGERIVVFDAFGSHRVTWTPAGGDWRGLALDGKGRLAVAGQQVVLLLAPSGEVLERLTPTLDPVDVAFSPDGHLHVLDGKTGELLRIASF